MICLERIIQQRILNASHAHTKHDYFEEILSMLVEILHKQQEEGSKISDAIDVVLYILILIPHIGLFLPGFPVLIEILLNQNW